MDITNAEYSSLLAYAEQVIGKDSSAISKYDIVHDAILAEGDRRQLIVRLFWKQKDQLSRFKELKVGSSGPSALPKTAICSGCREDLPLSGFYSESDGRPSAMCKYCQCKRTANFRENNLEKVQQRERGYAINNREKRKSAAKNWYKKNKKKAIINVKTWGKKNPDKCKKYTASWYRKNKAKRMEYQRKYRARKKAPTIL